MNGSPAQSLGVGRWLERHWLAVLNLAAGVFAALPLIAPLLLVAGLQAPALWIYGLYRAACHQWPGRSYFLFGAEPAYSMEALGALGQASAFVGSPTLGWKVAWCERDLAIYGTVFVAGLVYAALRDRARPLPWQVFLVCLLPIALDGFTQLLGWRESTPLLRTLTGVLTGWAAVWLVYPRLALALRSEAVAVPAPPGARAAWAGGGRRTG